MITATEASGISHGAFNHLGLVQRGRLAWICGRINRLIQKAALNGRTFIFITIGEYDSLARACIKIYPILAYLYEEMEYTVIYRNSCITEENFIGICWDIKNTPYKEFFGLRDYTYHTPSTSKEKTLFGYTAQEITRHVYWLTENCNGMVNKARQQELYNFLKVINTIAKRTSLGLPIDYD